MIAEGRLDVLIFFQDPLTALPHDVDDKALTRLATLYNIPFAINHATADAVLAAV
jgi:methylglyoxal synthase